MSCLCACDSPEEKIGLATILRQEERELQMLAVQEDMWRAGKFGLQSDGLISPSPKRTRDDTIPPEQHERLRRQKQQQLSVPTFKVDEVKKMAESASPSNPLPQSPARNPRFRRHIHQQNNQLKKSMKALTFKAIVKQAAIKAQLSKKQAMLEQSMTDVGGFDWNRMSQNAARKIDPAMVALGRESDKIDDVYDPTEDPDNIGPGDTPGKKHAQWWSEDSLKGSKLNDQWWQHGGEDGMTG
jgi:hypothetical protein